MIRVEKSKCSKCNRCIEVCPFTVLEVEDGYPKMIKGKPCMECLHCVSTCPSEALLFNQEKGTVGKKKEYLDDEFRDKLKSHIMNRRSYRNFTSEKVSQEKIIEAMKVSSYVASAKNQHPTRWIILRDENLIEKIMKEIIKFTRETGISKEIVSEYEKGNNVVMGNATTLILCYADNGAINPSLDTGIAMTTLELYLQSLGIGTCFAGYLTRSCNNISKVKELLPLPEGSSFYGAFMVGYPKEDYPFIPKRIKEFDIKIL